MKTITTTTYVADDGTEFNTKENCEYYESTETYINNIKSRKIIEDLEDNCNAGWNRTLDDGVSDRGDISSYIIERWETLKLIMEGK